MAGQDSPQFQTVEAMKEPRPPYSDSLHVTTRDATRLSIPANKDPNNADCNNPNTFDEEILALEGRLASLKYQKNLRSLPNRLAVELLCNIFILVRNNSSMIRTRMSPGWLSITQVCRRWRTTALSCAKLWTILDYETPTMAFHMLERSKQVPLRVHMVEAKPYEVTRAFNTTLATASHRIETLDFRSRATYTVDMSSRFENLGKDAPCLQKLRIYGYRNSQKVKLPSVFTMNGAPRLTHLTLVNVAFNWTNIPLGPSLVQLHLGGARLAPADEPSWRDVTTAFAKTPLLTTLTLGNVLPPTSPPPSARTTQLPKLKHLRLIDKTTRCREFVKCIRTAVSYIDMALNGNDIATQGYITATVDDMKSTSVAKCQTLHSLRLSSSYEEHIALFNNDEPIAEEEAWTTSNIHGPTGCRTTDWKVNHRPDSTLLECDSGSKYFVEEVVSSLPMHFNVDTVDTVHLVKADANLSDASWKQLSSLPGLRCLTMRSIPVERLTMSLVTQPEDGTSPYPFVYFHALKELHISDPKFSRSDRTLLKLLAALMRRQDAHRPVKTTIEYSPDSIWRHEPNEIEYAIIGNLNVEWVDTKTNAHPPRQTNSPLRVHSIEH